MKQLPETLRDNVRLLGDLLGETLTRYEGSTLFNKVEEIRSLAKSLNLTNDEDDQPLIDMLSKIDDKDILPVVRAFNQFLNLANIADQNYFSSPAAENNDPLDDLLKDFETKVGKESLFDLLKTLKIELVLTAHPTEVTRRTLIRKYDNISRALTDISSQNVSSHESSRQKERLLRLIEEVWNTNEIRDTKPTAIDEAKWGFAVVENSLWKAIPKYIRHLNDISRKRLNSALPLDVRPFKIYSWMGGDRDGNPNVTYDVTQEVIWLGRWKAADLFLQDVHSLGGDLSMHAANQTLKDIVGEDQSTPYRKMLHNLRERLSATKEWAENCLNGNVIPAPKNIINAKSDLLEPLMLCYQSLHDCGFEHIAQGPLTDTLRRVHAFGINLSPLDIRQDSERHTLAIAEIVEYLGMNTSEGSYDQWSEAEKQAFLLERLQEKRPLTPKRWRPSGDTQEVLDTCRIIAEQPRETLACYAISMAEQPSDVLAVALLLKEAGMSWKMPIVPLFETLDDLDRAASVMDKLWNIDWYLDYIKGEQTVMIGYSDSAKDAGKFMANWALYKAQEKLVNIAEQHKIKLGLFHGRGGTVGRGGGPVEKAMSSQPPGSVKGRVRVTEQGEMIRYKFGMPRTAFRSLNSYLMATLKATVTPNPAPKQEWRDLIEKMSAASLEGYRSVVRGHEHFVPYFRSLTPEQELGKLALGSRPAKRKATGGIESLRAIPWVFAWTQVRLNLPGWLGARQALDYGMQNEPIILSDMVNNWPFFSSFLDLLEMVIGKADEEICGYYERQLVDKEYQDLGKVLRGDLKELARLLPMLKANQSLLEDDPILQLQIAVRRPYIDPLNYLQAELLKRDRRSGDISPDLEQALKVTMAGISAGMRNTG